MDEDWSLFGKTRPSFSVLSGTPRSSNHSRVESLSKRVNGPLCSISTADGQHPGVASLASRTRAYLSSRVPRG